MTDRSSLFVLRFEQNRHVRMCYLIRLSSPPALLSPVQILLRRQALARVLQAGRLDD